MASTITGVPFGVTVHAVEIYIGRILCRKLRDASLVVTVGFLFAPCLGTESTAR